MTVVPHRQVGELGPRLPPHAARRGLLKSCLVPEHVGKLDRAEERVSRKAVLGVRDASAAHDDTLTGGPVPTAPAGGKEGGPGSRFPTTGDTRLLRHACIVRIGVNRPT